MDKLERMFELQYELNRRIGVDARTLDTPELKTQWIKQYALALSQELAEAVDCVPWKHWKKNQELNLPHLREELVDCFHFLISLSQVAGMSAQDVFDLYAHKNQVNHERQQTGY